jgi:hypothetical protein
VLTLFFSLSLSLSLFLSFVSELDFCACCLLLLLEEFEVVVGGHGLRFLFSFFPWDFFV